MICPSCLKQCNKMIKGECKNCYSKNYQKQKRLENKIQIALTAEQEEILIGSMLGDGSLLYSSPYSKNPRLAITRQKSDENYLVWQYNKLQNLFKSGIKNYSTFDKRTQKIYDRVYLQSKALQCLSMLRNIWYIDNTKIIPRDIKLTPLVCLIWFCDDGSIIRRTKKAIELKLSTHGFSLEDNIFLVNLLHKEFNETFRLVKDNNHYYIVGSSKAAFKFISYIDDIFPECMSRKSDKWRISKDELWNGIIRGPYKK